LCSSCEVGCSDHSFWLMTDIIIPLQLPWRHAIPPIRLLLLYPDCQSPLLASALIWWVWLRNNSFLLQ
jgi:hypothetical protein